MKCIMLTFFIWISTVGIIKAQSLSDRGPDLKKEFNYRAPVFADFSRFKRDMEEHIDLKSVVDEIKKQDLIGNYEYSFRVGKKGDIEPNSYAPEELSEYHVITEYIKNVFNRFLWKPAYLKKNKKIKMISYLNLTFYFAAETKYDVEITINMLGDANRKKLYHWIVPYAKLQNH